MSWSVTTANNRYERHHPPVYDIIRYFKKKGREGGGIKLEIYTKGL